MTALRLYSQHTKAALIELQEQVATAPSNQAVPGGLFIHTAAARKKLDDIAQAIAWHMADERAARGHPVPVSGYSGRKTNRLR